VGGVAGLEVRVGLVGAVSQCLAVISPAAHSRPDLLRLRSELQQRLFSILLRWLGETFSGLTSTTTTTTATTPTPSTPSSTTLTSRANLTAYVTLTLRLLASLAPDQPPEVVVNVYAFLFHQLLCEHSSLTSPDALAYAKFLSTPKISDSLNFSLQNCATPCWSHGLGVLAVGVEWGVVVGAFRAFRPSSLSPHQTLCLRPL